ncbi:MAG: hypothetical protein ACRC1Z_11560 [Waterburya sp.]
MTLFGRLVPSNARSAGLAFKAIAESQFSFPLLLRGSHGRVWVKLCRCLVWELRCYIDQKLLVYTVRQWLSRHNSELLRFGQLVLD